LEGAAGLMPQVQQRLFDFAMDDRDPDAFVVTEANRAARELVLRWRQWPGGACLLSGPPGSGRSHLGRVWARDAEAGVWRPGEDAHAAFARLSGRVLVDDADACGDEEGLIRLFDLARSTGGAVLFIVGETAAGWRPGLADLRSRLSAAPRARLSEPDPALLSLVLQRLCRERYLLLPPASASFLALRMERSFAAARAIAKALDEGVGPEGARALSTAALRRVLGDMLDGYGEDAFSQGDEDAPP
jgi:chromosomal replication initiation ATPase DnaA